MTRHSPYPPQQTLRLDLRLSGIEDRKALIDLEHDAEVMRFINGGRAIPPDENRNAHEYITPRGGETDLWVAVERSTGDFIGWFSLRRSTKNSAELGYRLKRSAWGLGFGSEGARAVVQFGFSAVGLTRIFATTMAVNQASRRVLENAGLRHSGTNYMNWPDPLPGSEQGDVEYEITRIAWESGPMTR